MHKDIETLLNYTMQAPSGHNTQPWTIMVDENQLLICPDLSRRLPVVDPDDHALYISLGCALENLVVASKGLGYTPNVELFPASAPDCIRVGLERSTPVPTDPLFQAIPKRQATRRTYDGRPIPSADLTAIETSAERDGVRLKTFTEKRDIDPLIGFVKEANVLQFENRAFVDELIEWIRFNDREAKAQKDGLRSASMGMPSVPRWLGRWILKTMTNPQGEAKKAERAIRSSSALLLFIATDDTAYSWIQVGRSFERAMLKAADLDIRHAHLNMPCEERPVREKLVNHLNLSSGHPMLLIRLGYGDLMPPSFRRESEAVTEPPPRGSSESAVL